MTSNPPAQPRRPPPNALTGLIRHRSYSSLPTARVSNPLRSGGEDLSMLSDGEERPSKRRRIVSHGSSPVSSPVTRVVARENESSGQKANSQYTRANWQDAVLARNPVKPLGQEDLGAPPPLPRPLWGNDSPSDPLPPRVRTSCRYRADIPVPNTPDTIHSSASAPLLDLQTPADYFPWTGKHPEDVISESNVKNGYHDRPPHPPERELNTAKAPLYNAFKHRSGLESLAALFTLVLERKSKHGALSSVSTFRPPPRVTLTEAKRRSWLADLADGDVPLRRLSRTIPQGVRGLPLLEQCLVHNVPVNRAIWFVKCVGANEIRTLKRKGVNPNVTVGAENKWLKDWTANIEHFLDTTIGQCGSEKWLENIRYCFQLCARLYHENLMDRDHFLDWLVKNFAACTVELIAAWLPLVQLFRADLIRFRKRARQLAGAFVQRYAQVSKLEAATTLLGEKLRGAIRSMVAAKPACFLMPDAWKQSRESLQNCLDLKNEQEKRVFDVIEQRNERMLGTDLQNESTSSHDKEVFDLLDSASPPFKIEQISTNLQTTCRDHRRLCGLCLEWATSRFRGSSFRIYLVARLLRRWQSAGVDIDSTILTFYSQARDPSMLDIGCYRHLFAEFSRSRSFSKSRFLQNLSIRGAKTQGDDSPVCTLLLRDLCLVEAEEHMVNLRNHLVAAESSTPVNSHDQIHLHLEALQKAFTEVDAESQTAIKDLFDIEALRQLEWSSKFEISAWLRSETARLSRLAAIELPGKPPLPGGKPFLLGHFLILRDALEATGDVAVLADVLHALSVTKQEAVLAALVDTVHFNAAALSAIGALEPLQKLYGQSYVSLRTMRPCILLFAAALADLCQHFPCPVTPLRALQQDLIRGDRGRALAACSPFSDGVAESLQQAGETFTDDFEAILLGEPNMSEQTMTSLFSVLVSRIMKSDGTTTQQNAFTLCQLLARLRLFRPVQGDTLIKKWLARLFSAAWSPVHHGIVLELLYTRCVTFEGLLDLANQAPAASKCKQAVREMVTASLLSHPTLSGRPEQVYVLKIAARRLLASDPTRCLDILLSQNDRESATLDICASILPHVLGDKQKWATFSPVVSKGLAISVDELLNIRATEADGLSQLMARVNWLSMPFCCYRMPVLLGQPTDQTSESENEQKAWSIYQGLRGHGGGEKPQPERVQLLLEAIPAALQDQVRSIAEKRFFESMPKFFHGKANGPSLQFPPEEKTKCIAAMEDFLALGPAKAGSTTSDGNGMLIEKLTMIAKVLSARLDGQPSGQGSVTPSSPVSPAFQSLQAALPPPGFEQKYREFVLGLVDYLNMVLRVVGAKAGQFATSASTAAGLSKTTQNEQIKLVALLSSIAIQPSLASVVQSSTDEASRSKIRECTSFAQDVAARMADDLSDEARILCARILKDRLRDERVMWLVGSMNSCLGVNITAGQGLVVIHETKGSLGEFRPKQWELLESGGGKESDTCLGLGLFGAKRI